MCALTAVLCQTEWEHGNTEESTAGTQLKNGEEDQKGNQKEEP